MIRKPTESVQHGKGEPPAPELGELFPDAWTRFERAVDTVIKSGPQHRQAITVKSKERPPSKGRVHKGKSRA